MTKNRHYAHRIGSVEKYGCRKKENETLDIDSFTSFTSTILSKIYRLVPDLFKAIRCEKEYANLVTYN